MFVLLGTEIEGKVYVFEKDLSFIIWCLHHGLDRLNSRDLPPLDRGGWASFNEGDFRSWRYLSPKALEVVLCRLPQEHLERLEYDPWQWLRLPLVALVNSDYASEFELVPVELVDPALDLDDESVEGED